MKAIIPIFLALALAAASPARAADFFGVPDKTVVPKPVATPVPAPATPAPATPAPTRGPATPAPITAAPVDETPPTLIPDAMQLKTPAVGGAKDAGRPFRDLGPDNGVLIGLEYTVGTGDGGAKFIESVTPLYVRPAGKAHGTLRGTLKPGNPATVLEARPGFAIAAIEARGTDTLEAFRVTFMRYENGALDRAERYTGKWIGGESAAPAQSLRTDTRPIVGIYGKADTAIREFGLIVRRETPKAPAVATTNPFGTPVIPGSIPKGDEPPEPAADMPDDAPATTAASPLTPTAFDSTILRTDHAGGEKDYGTPFRDLSPAGSLLTGFDYAVTETYGKPYLQSLRPLYLLANGSKKSGDLHGEAKTTARIEARSGYAVGAVAVKSDGILYGMQITFMKLKGPALNPADSYQSDWIGGDKVGAKLLTGSGQIFVGLIGKSGKDVNELAFLVKKSAAPLASTGSGIPTPPADTTAGGVEVFACADDEFTLFLNGREILAGTNYRQVESGSFPIVKGDVLTAVVKDKGGGGGEAWLSLRVVRGGKTVLDAGDLRYLTAETLNWKTNKLTTGFKDPKVWTHELTMGTDKRPRAAWASAKDSTATVLYFKGLVP